jgi:CRP/FNR family cyclic AMP-dependent transcriptional regulator
VPGRSEVCILSSGDVVYVIREDLDLAQDLDAADLVLAQRRSGARLLTLAPGTWSPVEDPAEAAGLLGLLVLEGFIVSRVTLAARRSAEVLGPGDVIRPFEAHADLFPTIPWQVSWHVLQRARLALLDERFQQTMAAAYPQVICRLAGRQSRRCHEQAVTLAIVQLPQLGARLHFTLWRLASRFGYVARDGVVLPLRLSHELLAELVAAQRPSVTHALKELEATGLVARHPTGHWRLAGRAPSTLAELARATATADA